MPPGVKNNRSTTSASRMAQHQTAPLGQTTLCLSCTVKDDMPSTRKQHSAYFVSSYPPTYLVDVMYPLRVLLLLLRCTRSSHGRLFLWHYISYSEPLYLSGRFSASNGTLPAWQDWDNWSLSFVDIRSTRLLLLWTPDQPKDTGAAPFARPWPIGYTK